MIRKKVIAIALAVSLTSGFIQNPIKAEALSIDELYANAYRATVAAMEGKNQKLINEARLAINMLPKKMEWAVGEFSKQVDKVQQPIFAKAYNAVLLAEKNPTQANIDAGKAAIDPDMPIYYRGSYSSKLDEIQQKKMKEALDAYNKALKSNLKEDMDLANKLLSDIKTSKNLAIAEWVDLVQAKGNIKDLNNGKVNINNYSILSESGTFGAKNENSPTTVKGNILISNTGGKSLTLQNINIEGTLTVNFGSGDVVLNNVKVNGVIVNNIGANSLHVKGKSEIKDISIKDSDNDARIVIEDNASIQNANVLSGAKLEVAKNSTNSKAFANVVIAPTDSNKIILEGKFENISVDKSADVEVTKDSKVSAITLNSDAVIKGNGDIAKVNIETSAEIDIQAKFVQTLEVSKKAEGAKVNISDNTKVNTLNVNSPVNVTGSGAIENANIGANGTTIEIKPGNVSVTEGVKVEVAGEVKDESNSNVIEKVPEVSQPEKPEDLEKPNKPETPEKPEDSEESTPPVVVPPSNGGNEDYNPPVDTKPVINTFIDEIYVYLGKDTESNETYEANNNGTLKVLKKYKYYFSGLSKLDELSDKHQLRYAASFRSILRYMNAEGVKFTYSKVEEVINSTYESIKPIIESSKFKGHFEGKTPIIDFTVPEGEEDLDVTDDIIGFDSPLSEGTTYEILGIYDYINNEKVENKYFYVKENRIFVKPNNKVGIINTSIDIRVKTNGGSNYTNTNLSLQAKFKENPYLNDFIEEVKKYFGEDTEDYETYEYNNSETLKILNKYKFNFSGLSKLDELSDKHQLRYAASFRSILKNMNDEGVKFTYSKVEEVIDSTYKSINPLIEASKFKGHFDGETPIIDFTVPEGEEDLDVTDDIIGFDSPLNEGTTYEILGVYDYINDEKVENKYFYVKENKIFVKPNNEVGTINTNIDIIVKTKDGSTHTNLSLQANFPEDPTLVSLREELSQYFGKNIEDKEDYETNNSGTLQILKKYKSYFSGLIKLDQLSDKYQLKYSASFRSILRYMNADGIKITYNKIEEAINEANKAIEPVIEASKFKGHYEAETSVIDFIVPEGEEDLDVTDDIIGFDSPLNEGTTYEILSVYDYDKDYKEIENNYFYVKENRIFVKPNNRIGRINTNIKIKVITNDSYAINNLSLKASFPKELSLDNFIEEISKYFGEDNDDYETSQINNKGTLKILEAYKNYFQKLNKLDELSDKFKLSFASTVRSSIESLKNKNIELNDEIVEAAIMSWYSLIKLEMEESKFKGAYNSETYQLILDIPQVEEEIDFTDNLIVLDSPLSGDTTYEIVGVSGDGNNLENECFFLKDDRIFLKPNNRKGTLNVTIHLKIKSGDAGGTLGLKVLACF